MRLRDLCPGAVALQLADLEPGLPLSKLLYEALTGVH